jgi:hypothetical protein
VLVDGLSIPRGTDTWDYVNGSVVFAPNGQVCRRLKEATSERAVDIEIRILEVL